MGIPDKAQDVLALVLRLAIGGLFVYSSWGKLQDPALFADTVSRYDMLPGRLLGFFAAVMPAAELVAGAALAFLPWRREAAVAVCVLLAMFLIALVQALARGLDISCGCFGVDESDTGARGLAKAILRDVALLAPALWLALRPYSPRNCEEEQEERK